MCVVNYGGSNIRAERAPYGSSLPRLQETCEVTIYLTIPPYIIYQHYQATQSCQALTTVQDVPLSHPLQGIISKSHPCLTLSEWRWAPLSGRLFVLKTQDQEAWLERKNIWLASCVPCAEVNGCVNALECTGGSGYISKQFPSGLWGLHSHDHTAGPRAHTAEAPPTGGTVELRQMTWVRLRKPVFPRAWMLPVNFQHQGCYSVLLIALVLLRRTEPDLLM